MLKMKQKLNNIETIPKLSRRKTFFLFIISGVLLLMASSFLFIRFGVADVNLKTIIESFTSYDKTLFSHIVIRESRLPRVIANIIVGSSLAVTGSIMQGSTRNPLADSGLMGISSGSTLAIAFCLAILPAVTKLEMMAYACIGAAITTFLTYFIASMGKRGLTPERLVLAGMSVSMLFGSFSSALAIKYGIGRALTYWVLGGTASANWMDIKIGLPIFICGMLAAIAISRSITVMSLGEDVAIGLGINLKAIKLVSSIIVLMLTALSVIIIGPVGFVGLIVPHIVRFVVGVDYRYIVPASAIYGAFFVVTTDLLGRIIMKPFELPIGILFSIIGVPFLIYLSRKQRREFE